LPYRFCHIMMSRSVLDTYETLAASGRIERDAAQVALARRLDALAMALAGRAQARKGSALGWLFSRRSAALPPLKGLYIWGDVGRGKTWLMDLFFESVKGLPKRRVHFHAFMADVHERIHAWRQRVKRGEVQDADPIAPVAADIAREAQILCFDEFVVTDIADAMILARLFDALFAAGVIVVATSNVAPQRLYEGGLNRALFMPFIAALQAHCDVTRLGARTDFRLEKLGTSPVWFTPADAGAKAALGDVFTRLTGEEKGEPFTFLVKGHDVHVPEAAASVARAGFADLCAEALGAADYLALAQRFHTLVLDDVPLMGMANRNEARRFIILIDTLYERNVKLVCSAAAEPQALYRDADGYEAFAFERTVSRLIEMRSTEYLARPHGQADSTASGATTGLVET
jgi:cell division protein ZapE